MIQNKLQRYKEVGLHRYTVEYKDTTWGTKIPIWVKRYKLGYKDTKWDIKWGTKYRVRYTD